MPLTPDPRPDSEVLIQRYLEGILHYEEAAQLLELLRADASLGERLLAELSMDAMLRDLKATATPIVKVSAIKDAGPSRRFGFGALSIAAALAACITLCAAWLWWSLRPAPSEKEATTSAVAVLARGVNLQWDDSSPSPQPGTPLTPGWLRLKSGVAQIEFYQGARVTLEGPAALRLISSGEAFCSAGRLSAHVPPQARGFRVRTPQGSVVDLGTDFGLDLSKADAPQVHVFKGEVEWHPEGAAMSSLKAGQATKLDADKTALTADRAAFASLANLDERTADSERLAFEDWLVRSRRYDDDPSLLVRFDFQDAAATRSLINHARRSSQIPPGSIVGCEWTEGRWIGKRALEFRNVSDRVRLSVPGEFRDLTLSAWIRVNGLDRAFNSLFMAEGYSDGAVHWQITRQGVLRLGIAGRGGYVSTDYDTSAIFTPERFGQWLHLATVYDSHAQQVRHYLNGRLVAALPVKHVFPLRLSVAELGNWNDGGRSDRVPVRHFSGAMQEFFLFNRALSPGELGDFR